jgi:hypothetical protein
VLGVLENTCFHLDVDPDPIGVLPHEQFRPNAADRPAGSQLRLEARDAHGPDAGVGIAPEQACGLADLIVVDAASA